MTTRADTLGKIQTHMEPTPIRRNRPVARRRALVVIQDAAAETAMIPSPSSLLASQKSVTELRFLDDCRPMRASTAMYNPKKTRKR